MRHRLMAPSLIIAAVALIAVAAGHAIELALENRGVLGDVRAGYEHIAQLPIIEVAVLLIAFALIVISDAALRAAATQGRNPDWLLPSLNAIENFGLAKLSVVLAPVQLAVFTMAELAEQSADKFAQSNSLVAIFGAGHLTTLPVHLVVALCFAVALWLGARFVCRQAASLAEFAQAAIAWIDARSTTASASPAYVRTARAAAATAPLKVLARRIANRPPPVSAPRPA